ncbi:MAG: hypothetical protein AAF750_13080 [Planctomycetota bacterium]
MASSTDDLRVPLMATMLVVTTVLLIAVTLAVRAWFAWETAREEDDKLINATNSTLNRMNEANIQEGWVEVETPVAAEGETPAHTRVPIEQAMRLVVERANPAAAAPASTQTGGDTQ